MGNAIIQFIIPPVIVGLFSVFVQMQISQRTTTDLYAKLDKQSELTDQKLLSKIENLSSVTGEKFKALEAKVDRLDKKVEKHNSMIERQYKLEGEVKVHEEKLNRLTNSKIVS